ncbi:hypothetical protein [Burkholderia cenocepacia]|uniref:hypothetical protein n=1 Tax=Burkholderia cenocepacia TaxID=95486 RepID=UPI00285CA490|nr:hypothetical protein [Burkholderia cenocepacia]MDR8057652.1 hypothetical protein [Burkholderia cenocepacia]MDR8062256.1 hypothetical protein [Burkholderia cenocepacia]
MAKTTNTTETTTTTKSGKTRKTSKPKTAGPAGGDASDVGDGGTVLPNQTVWEDTVIIAFRDLQWHRWREALKKARGAKRSALLAASPADLHKLDHDAESAFGDVLTSQDARYFLFEFKAVRDGHVDERGKGMFERLSHFVTLAASTVDQNAQLPPPVQTLIDLSKRCHFGVFGRLEALTPNDAAVQAATPTPFPFQTIDAPSLSKPAVRLRLLADPYIEWVHLANRSLADAFTKARATKQAEAQTTPDAERSAVQKATLQELANAAMQEAKDAMAKVAEAAAGAAVNALRKTALALLAKANKVQVEANREERAAVIAVGRETIERISIDQIDDPIPLESIVWEVPPSTQYGVSLEELAVYLAALLDLPGPGQPKSPSGGLPGDLIRINLVRVINGDVVQWTLTASQIRNAANFQRIVARPDDEQDVTGDVEVDAGAPSSTPTKHTKQISIGGTEKEPSNDPKDQA